MATIATQASGVKASSLETELEDMDAGVLKNLPAKGSLTINGTAMTPAQMDTQIQAYLKTLQAADAARTQYQAAVVARRNMQVEARDFYLQLKKAIVAYFGAQSAQLADFGLTPAKAKTARTSAQKAVTQAKVQLTRAARGTTSKKQKAAINPTVANPAVAIGPDGKLTPIPPTVVDGVLPTGSTPAASGSSTAASNGSTSTPQGNAASGVPAGTSGVSAPTVPAGSGASGSGA
jgi:hypothetical protein